MEGSQDEHYLQAGMVNPAPEGAVRVLTRTRFAGETLSEIPVTVRDYVVNNIHNESASTTRGQPPPIRAWDPAIVPDILDFAAPGSKLEKFDFALQPGFLLHRAQILLRRGAN